jgi:hypothetical protein
MQHPLETGQLQKLANQKKPPLSEHFNRRCSTFLVDQLNPHKPLVLSQIHCLGVILITAPFVLLAVALVVPDAAFLLSTILPIVPIVVPIVAAFLSSRIRNDEATVRVGC